MTRGRGTEGKNLNQHRSSVTDAHQHLRVATKKYEEALKMARRDGVSYLMMASWVDLTEAAIRLRFKRKGWDG